jgi:hypothetical protein
MYIIETLIKYKEIKGCVCMCMCGHLKEFLGIITHEKHTERD